MAPSQCTAKGACRLGRRVYWPINTGAGGGAPDHLATSPNQIRQGSRHTWPRASALRKGACRLGTPSLLAYQPTEQEVDDPSTWQPRRTKNG